MALSIYYKGKLEPKLHEAKAIADHFKRAGIRVDLKPSIDASIETEDILQGRFSNVIGSPVATEIAKVLEKNGIIKIKGNIIRWKK